MKTGLFIFTALVFFQLPYAAFTYNGPLPDFNADKDNQLKDCETGMLLDPKLPGTGFEFASPTAVDYNEDGLFDLLVGYNLQTPDSLKLVVFINHGAPGYPAFTGRASDTTCFFVKVKYPGQTEFREFAALGYHPTAEGDNHRFMEFVPSIFDWNHDGKFDVFITEGTCDNACGCCGTACATLWNRRGNWLLINTGTPGRPEFGNVVNITYNPYNTGYTGFTITNAQFQGLSLFQSMSCNGNFPQATLVDWNNDGIMDISYAVKWTDILFGDTLASGQWKPKTGTWLHQTGLPADSGFGHMPLLRMADFNHNGTNEVLSIYGQNSEFWLFVRNPDTAGAEYYVKDSTLYRRAVIGWHPKFDIVDYDEDGYWDVLCGWGRGNGETPQPGIWYYRSTIKGTPGSQPFQQKFSRTENSLLSRNNAGIVRVSTFPNPSAAVTRISWSPARADGIEICDIAGRIVRSFKNSKAGFAAWDGLDNKSQAARPGVYIIRLHAGNRVVGCKHLVVN